MNKCLILIATASALGSAAVHAADAPQRPRPEACTEQYVPVCAEKGGVRKTYSNACFAAVEQSVVVAQGQCPSTK